jgi:hypothetical protein
VSKFAEGRRITWTENSLTFAVLPLCRAIRRLLGDELVLLLFRRTEPRVQGRRSGVARVSIFTFEICGAAFSGVCVSPIADLEASATHPQFLAENSQEPDECPEAYRKCRSCGELIDCISTALNLLAHAQVIKSRRTGFNVRIKLV